MDNQVSYKIKTPQGRNPRENTLKSNKQGVFDYLRNLINGYRDAMVAI